MSWKTFFNYFRVGGGYIGAILILLFFVVGQLLVVSADYWVSSWLITFLICLFLTSVTILKIFNRASQEDKHMYNKIHISLDTKNHTFLCDKRNCSLKQIFLERNFDLYENRNHNYHLYMG